MSSRKDYVLLFSLRFSVHNSEDLPNSSKPSDMLKFYDQLTIPTNSPKIFMSLRSTLVVLT